MRNFPTEDNPDGKYKYMSFAIEMSPDLQMTSRQTYSILDFMGDLGGLAEALNFLVYIMLVPFTTFHFQSNLM